jgi:hypothetical protein
VKDFSKILISVLIFSAIFGCKKEEVFPNTPTIKLESFSSETIGVEKLVKVSISFTDGDGDFGLSESESVITTMDSVDVCVNGTLTKKYSEVTTSVNSLFAALKEKKNDSFLQAYITNTFKTDCEIKTDTITLHQTLPIVEPRGADKGLSGTINTQFLIPIQEAQVKRDISILEIYIEDRAKNRSNVIVTPEIVF